MNILFITTSANAMGDHPTGLWLEEFAVPYEILSTAGARITVASPKGGAVPLDPKTEPDDDERQKWAAPLAALQSTRRLADVDGAEYDAVFLPGGHGPLVDLTDNADVARIVQAVDARQGVVSAVCHGPTALLNVRRADGRPFVDGKRITGFTNTEELLAGLSKDVPFSLQDMLKERGGDFHSALLPYTSHVEQDQRLVTGQNPQSSKAVGVALREALGLPESAAAKV